jgi:D-arabinose 1-dehydrogenase-like Zn-dependent alcohol dehydrogenase
LCHSDIHLINGEWKDLIPLNLPKTPRHEVAGLVEETGKSGPEDLLKSGDLVRYLEDGDAEYAFIVKEEMNKCVDL